MAIKIPESVIEKAYAGSSGWCGVVLGDTPFEVDLQMDNISPIDGQSLGSVGLGTPAHINRALSVAKVAQRLWRQLPAPLRGELVAEIGREAKANKASLAEVITADVGKTTQEALGEVQEWIDMCEFAVGLSRQLYGLTIASERPGHRLMEQWHPLGVVGVISAFNFPMAVWSWNAMLSFVCGNAVIWKGSEKSPLCTLACHTVVQRALKRFVSEKCDKAVGEVLLAGLHSVVTGDGAVGAHLAAHESVDLISATGSTVMGRKVAVAAGQRLGRSLLELGGNNAAIVSDAADLKLAIPAVVFSAAGTSGQRCTSLRRLFVHSSIYEHVLIALTSAFDALKVGDPRVAGVHMGPLIDVQARQAMHKALEVAKAAGGEILSGDSPVSEVAEGGAYVRPALVKISAQVDIVQQETFAPILYVMPYQTIEEAIELNNAVPQGLSSSIFTQSMREAEYFMSAAGSDCGIVNVNVGTSGAEIGGAFGGEKDTGGGRESGSDAWKAYMRRTTNTINYSNALPLAQGIEFDIPEV